MSFGAFIDSQNSPSQQQSSGGFGSFLDGKPASQQFIQTEKVNGPQPLIPINKYTSIDEAAKKAIGNQANGYSGGGIGSELIDLSKNAWQDTKDTVSGLGKLAVEAPVGVISNLLANIGLVDRPTEGFLGDSSKLASALPGVVKQIPGELKDAAITGYNATGLNGEDNAHAARYAMGNSIYEHPINALITASGLGSLIGGGVKAAGTVADRAATKAAIEAAGLTGEEAASALASTAANPGVLSSVGSQISSGSNLVNPMNWAVSGLTKTKDAGGKLVSKTSSVLNRTGSEGRSALETIASGGDEGRSAVSGMRGAPTTEESQAYQDAVRSIDMKNTPNAAMFSPESMTQLKKNVTASLSDHGINVMVMTPEDQNIVIQDLQRGILSPQSESVFDRYWSKIPDATSTATDTTGQIKTKFLSSNWKPELSAQQKATILEDAVSNGGLVGVQPTLETTAKFTDKTLKNIMDRVVKPIFQTGSYNGYEATAGNLNTLKQAAHNLYTENSPLIPISNESKAVNALSKDIADSVSAPLRQFPEYQAVMNRYKSYYGGQSLNKLLPGSLQSIASGKDIVPLLEGLGSYGLTHMFGPSGMLGILGTSPRLSGEIANLYSKVAPVYGSITSPITAASRSGAISALLNTISGNTRQ